MSAAASPGAKPAAAEAGVVRVAAGAGLSGLWSASGTLLAFAGTAVLTRTVGAEAFGIVAVGLTLSGVFQILATWGMDRGLLKYVSLHLGAGRSDGIHRVVGAAVGLCLASSALLVFAYLAVGRAWVPTVLPRIEGAGSVVTAFVVFGAVPALLLLYTNALAAVQRPQYGQFAASVVRPVVQVGATLALVSWLSGVAALTAATLAAHLASLGFVALSFRRFRRVLRAELARGDAVPQPPDPELSRFVRFSLSLSLVPLLAYAGHRLDVLLVGSLLGSESAGVYAVVRRVGDLTLLPLVAFGGVTAATVSKCLAQQRASDVRLLYRFATRWVSLGSLVVFTVIGAGAEDLLAVFGPEFAAGALPLRVLAVAQLVNAAAGPSGNTLLVIGRERLVLWNSALGAALGVGLLLLLVPTRGLLGASLAVGVAASTVKLVSAAQLFFLEGIAAGGLRVIAGRAASAGLALLAASAAGSLFPAGFARLGAIGLTALLAGGSLALALEGVGRQERALLAAFQRRLPRRSAAGAVAEPGRASR